MIHQRSSPSSAGAVFPPRSTNSAVGIYRRPGRVDNPSYAAAPVTNNSVASANGSSKSNSQTGSKEISIPVAVFLWYFLGVISITTSKLLLSKNDVPPLVLTLQQLIIGLTLLRTLMEMQTTGEKEKDVELSRGLQPIPMQGDGGNEEIRGASYSILSAINPFGHTPHMNNELFLAGIYFSMGFLLTNYGFQSGSAAFVETVKAAEPFTSASVAVLWGIEILRKEEVASLTGIVVGVVMSTLGHRGSTTSVTEGDALEIPSHSLMTKCCVVMLSNICFSFRGLHQKLFRSTSQGSMIDDLNMQFRMQQIGAIVLILPAMFSFGSSFLARSKFQDASSLGGSTLKYFLQYTSLSLVNGVAFASYNLASTWILTRISIVHHAALNCTRRVFAIVVTSIIFGLKIKVMSLIGISLSVFSFFSYMHFKMKKEVKDKRGRELRKRWGGLMLTKGGKSSSILPIVQD